MNFYTLPVQAEIQQYILTHQLTQNEILKLIFIPLFLPIQLLLFIYSYFQKAMSFVHTFYIPIIIMLLFLGVIYIAFRLYLYKKSLEEKKVWLHIIPPDSVTQSPLSTQEFFTALHHIGMYTKKYFKIFHVKRIFSLELVATREDGIRYFILVSKEDVSIITKTLLSYVQGAKIQEQKSYMSGNKNNIYPSHIYLDIADIEFVNDFIFPLKEKKILEQHDPIGFLTGHMTKLAYGETVILQVVVTSVNSATHKKQVKKIQNVFNAVQNSYALTPYIKQRLIAILPWLPVRIIKFLFLFTIGLLFWQINLFFFLITFGGIKMLIIEVFHRKDEIVSLSQVEKQLYQDIGSKLEQGLFETSIRLLVATNKGQDISYRKKGIMSSFSTFDYPNYQFFKFRALAWWHSKKLSDKYIAFLFKNRELSLINNPILSVSELSNLYHLPYTSTTKTEGIVKGKTRTLPAPLSLKQYDPELDLMFGLNAHNGEETGIGLTSDERKRHMYLLGATGTGKTTLLSTMIYQDIQNGKGLCVIDPHGDLTQTILGTIPKHRLKDVIFFNPIDRSYPIGLNLLELRKDLTEEQLQDEKDIITSSIISVFHKLYTAKYFGPRMEHILRYAILAALETENPTLFTVQKFLTDKHYRNKIVSGIVDPVVKDFWVNEFKRLGSYQQAEMTSPITNKLGRFLSSPLCRNILGQKTSTINFDKILNDGKILLCSLPKGSIGEDNSAFFGVLVTAKIQLAALRRVSMPEKKRRKFYLYIDEFQNFATPSFAQILSEARKYGLSAILAHQTIAQLENRDLTKVILANTGTVICFRTSSPLDEEYILPIFEPQVKKGEISNLPSYSFYCKINALRPYDTFSGEIEQFQEKENKRIMQKIIISSQQTYGVSRKLVEADINQFYQIQPQPAAIKTKKVETMQVINQETRTGMQ